MNDNTHIKNLKDVYSNLSDVYCPFLGEIVLFNNKGFRHLLYKAGNRKRSSSEIEIRTAMLIMAREVLEITTTVQELEMRVDSSFLGFIAIVNNFKLKIVVKKDGLKGKYHFYSVIPHFVTSPKRDLKNVI